jgi:hypothetical protein
LDKGTAAFALEAGDDTLDQLVEVLIGPSGLEGVEDGASELLTPLLQFNRAAVRRVLLHDLGDELGGHSVLLAILVRDLAAPSVHDRGVVVERSIELLRDLGGAPLRRGGLDHTAEQAAAKNHRRLASTLPSGAEVVRPTELPHDLLVIRQPVAW